MMLTGLLQGKQVVFICPEFHHYHHSITKAMEDAGATVHHIPTIEEKRNTTFKNRDAVKKYYRHALGKYAGKKIDLLFQVRGENIDADCYQPFLQSGTILRMYQWDSVRNYDYTKLIPVFHRVYSFDRDDCNVFNLHYLPLFHQLTADENKPVLYDLFTVGGFAYWRYKTCVRFYKIAAKHNLRKYLKLKMPFKTLLRFYMKGNYLTPALITFRNMDREKYTGLLYASKAVIDIPSPAQTGLTMRSIETIAAGKKLITCNAAITKEPFYSAQNILILDDAVDENAILDFINSPAEKVDMQEYHITNWLLKIVE